MGTLSLLQAAKVSGDGQYDGKRFYHISTDEVYGALKFDGTFFTETTKYDPHSPYSASKASSDHFDHRNQLFQQLRSLPIPGKANPFVYQ